MVGMKNDVNPELVSPRRAIREGGPIGLERLQQRSVLTFVVDALWGEFSPSALLHCSSPAKDKRWKQECDYRSVGIDLCPCRRAVQK